MPQYHLCRERPSLESSENRLNLAKLYFRKARADLESAKHLVSFAQYANAVFLAQQCGEKSAKATLAMKNIEVREHIVSGYLASEVVAFAPEKWEERMREVVRMLVALEEHSIRPRYPFVTASRIWDPETGYDKQAAEDAIMKAETILGDLEEFCVSNLGYVAGDATT
jgi:HEPN domain-containing protein